MQFSLGFMPLDKSDLRKLKQNNIDYNLIVTCYHEAGHIVLAMRNSILPKACQVMQGKRIIANTTLVYFNKIKKPALRKNIMLGTAKTYAAGIAAEEIFFDKIVGKRLPVNLREGWSSDRYLLQKILTSLEKRTHARARLREKIHKIARQQVIEDWHIVTNLAHALYDKKALSYKQISDVVIRSVPSASRIDMRSYLRQLEQAYIPKTLP